MTSGSAAVPIATASVKTPARRDKATSILRCLVRARRQRRLDSSRAKLFPANGLSARAPPICFGLPPRAWCDLHRPDRPFQPPSSAMHLAIRTSLTQGNRTNRILASSILDLVRSTVPILRGGEVGTSWNDGALLCSLRHESSTRKPPNPTSKREVDLMKTNRNIIRFTADGTPPLVCTVSKTGNDPASERIRIRWTEEGYACREAEVLFASTDLVNLVTAHFGADSPGIEGGFDPLAKVGLVSGNPNDGSGLSGRGEPPGRPPHPTQDDRRVRIRLTCAGATILETLLDATGFKLNMPFPIPAARAASALLQKCRQQGGLRVRNGESLDLALLDSISAGWLARKSMHDYGRGDRHFMLTPEGESILCALDAWGRYARLRGPSPA